MSGGDTEAVPFGSRKDFGFIGTAIYSARMSELLLRTGALTLSEPRALWATTTRCVSILHHAPRSMRPRQRCPRSSRRTEPSMASTWLRAARPHPHRRRAPRRIAAIAGAVALRGRGSAARRCGGEADRRAEDRIARTWSFGDPVVGDRAVGADAQAGASCPAFRHRDRSALPAISLLSRTCPRC